MSSHRQRRRGRGRTPGLAARPRARLLLGNGRARHQARLPGRRQRARPLGRRRAPRRRQMALPAIVVVLVTIALDVVYLVPWKGSIPLKFLVPGTVFLIGFQVIPILSNVNIGFTNWSTGHNLTQSEAIAAIEENSLTPPPNGATYTSTPGDEGRRADAPARRRVDRQGLRRLGRTAWCRSPPTHDRERHRHRRAGATRSSRAAELLTLDQAARGAPDPDHGQRVHPPRRPQPGGRAAAHSALRPRQGRVREHRDRRRLQRQRRGLVRLRIRRGARARLAHVRRLQELQARSSPTRSSATRSSASSSGRSSTRASPSSSPSPSGSSWRSFSTSRSCGCSGCSAPCS